MDSIATPRVLSRRLLPALLLLLPFSGCQCEDEVGPDAWEFGGPDASPPDVVVPPFDTGDVEPRDTRDARDLGFDTFVPENVVSDVECEDALNDRTSAIVDSEGTTWVAFHKYRSGECDESPSLVVARKPVGGEWTEETIQFHQGIFGINSVEAGRPVVVYPDPRNPRLSDRPGSGQFRAAHRRGPGDWEIRSLDIGDNVVEPGDGFDVTDDGESYWATFARDSGEMVRLFEFDTTDAAPEWEGRAPLPFRDPRPALARGLRANSEDSVYLVYQRDEDDPNSRFGVARYEKSTDEWPQTALLEDVDRETVVHSFSITEKFELCLANRAPAPPHLLVTCGTMSDLDREQQDFEDEQIPRRFPASITEGRDGTLYVAFHPPANNELRLAERDPDGGWSVQRIFDRPASGVSTAIDQNGFLVLAFYTETENGRFALKVLRERPADL